MIEPFSFPKSLREGQRASALCTVSSGDLPFKIRWFKDGRPIPDNIGVRSNEVADYSSTLLFESSALHHRGNYTCVAENDAGTVSHTATMVIHGMVLSEAVTIANSICLLLSSFCFSLKKKKEK